VELPLITFPELFHVGSFDIRNKRESSHEGDFGLSVTTEPEAWKRINRGWTVGDTHCLTKASNVFIDYHSVSTDVLKQIYQWGCDKKFLTPCTKYEFSYFDDEYDGEISFSFYSHAEALEEAEGFEASIEEVAGYKATSEFINLVGKKNSDDTSLIIVTYCLLKTDFDGVYWTDDLDVYRYSAPRGVILQDKLATWSRKIK